MKNCQDCFDAVCSNASLLTGHEWVGRIELQVSSGRPHAEMVYHWVNIFAEPACQEILIPAFPRI